MRVDFLMCLRGSVKSWVNKKVGSGQTRVDTGNRQVEIVLLTATAKNG